jgi:hypothetical protein
MHVHIILSSSKKSFIIISCLERFLGFNLYFCSKEMVENNLELEK